MLSRKRYLLPAMAGLLGLVFSLPVSAVATSSVGAIAPVSNVATTAATGVWEQLPSPPLGYNAGSRITRMLDGRVMLANDTMPPVVFDPTDETWTLTPAFTAQIGGYAGATLITLADGEVMLAGRFLFDPTTWTWSDAGNLWPGTSALGLRDGRVLSFGSGGCGFMSVYDPSTRTTSQVFGDPTICLSQPLMYQLADGRVLLHGTCGANRYEQQAGSGYSWFVDPVKLTMTITSTQDGTVTGTCSGGAVLASGQVLFAGWQEWGGYPYPPIWGSNVDSFDPGHVSWTDEAPLPVPMTVARTLLAIDDRALVVAGANGSGLVPSTLLFDPATNHWSTLTTWPGSMVEDSTILSDGSVFAIDNSARVYRLVPPPAPPLAHITSLASVQAATSIRVGWSGTPRKSALASYDVRYRRAAWNGNLGTYNVWLAATTATAASFSGAAGSTYCFSTRARDVDGLTSEWTAETCTGVPLDDRSLSHSGSWTSGTGTAYYQHTYRRSYSSGAALVRTGVVARRLTVVATTCPTCGKIRVYWGATLLRTISLYSATTVNRRPILIATFSGPRAGTVTIRVYGSGKRVLIDGLAVLRT